MQRISTFLWFDDKAEEAADFKTSIFPNSKTVSMIEAGRGRLEAWSRPSTVDNARSS